MFCCFAPSPTGTFEDEEIDEAVEALGYHKAAAADGNHPFYKCGGKEMRGHLKTLFNHLVDREVVPRAGRGPSSSISSKRGIRPTRATIVALP